MHKFCACSVFVRFGDGMFVFGVGLFGFCVVRFGLLMCLHS